MTDSISSTPTRVELSVLYCLLGIHVVVGTDAATPSGWVLFAALSALAVMILLLARIALAVLSFRRTPIKWGRWAEFLVVVSLLAVIHATNLGVAARVHLSEKRLYEQVNNARNSPLRESHFTQACGLFTVQGIFRSEDGSVVWLETVSGEKLFASRSSLWAGVAYCMSGVPPDRGEMTYEHLYGPWWVWRQDI